jgi:hypothetical protein
VTAPANLRRYNSGALLDATSISLPVPAAALDEALARDRLVRQPMDGAPPDLHPLFLDLWRVKGGHAELGGVDQHEWTARGSAVAAGLTGAGAGAVWGAAAGSATGALRGAQTLAPLGPWAAWWGSAVGSMVGASLGAATGARLGGRMFADVSGRAGRRASEQLSHTIGTYNEVLVGVPNVRPADRPAPPMMLVLGMYSDNPVALWGDRALGTGYRKRLASIRTETDTRFVVEADGVSALDSTVLPFTESAPDPPAADPPPPFVELYAQPLLGRLDDQRLVASVMERAFEAPARLLGPGRARVTIGPGFFPGVPALEHEVGPPQAGSPFGLLRASGVAARLTFPEPV